MVTGPWVVSRIKVFSVSAMLVSLQVWVDVAGSESDRERPAGDRTAQSLGKWQRRTALQCFHYGNSVRDPVVIAGICGFIGNPWLTENGAFAVETDDDRDVHRVGARGRRR